MDKKRMLESGKWTAAGLVEEATERLQMQLTDSPGSGSVEPYSARTLRFHRATGLLSVPTERRQKLLVFGERHLDEIVAMRRLQAAGWDLERVRDLFAICDNRDFVIRDVANEPPGPLRPELLDGLVELIRKSASSAGTPGESLDGLRVDAHQIAPGVYLVIDRKHVGPLNREAAYRVGERAAVWLTGDGEESRHDDAEREGSA